MSHCSCTAGLAIDSMPVLSAGALYGAPTASPIGVIGVT